MPSFPPHEETEVPTQGYQTHTWFDQHGKAVRRHQTRVKKAERVFPHPIDQLQESCTNTYTHEGRGFTLDELKAVKLTI
ncbi:Ribosomal_protein L13 [Hexamita inflata]|uniref:Ribosomal protein L13 n=1 Tax=Hexamita inflata TaxID=28002 RepID=A0AA86UXN6_9EUKA|nr:Ribosomal protein L13 [Hexamita inflata]